MDILSLYITGKILHLRISAVRLCLGGVIGGIYGVLSLFIGAGGIFGFLISTLVCAVICLTVFGTRTAFSVLLSMLCFFVTGAAVSGIMTALISALGRTAVAGKDTGDSMSGTVFITVSSIAAAITFIFGRLFSLVGGEKTAELTLTSGERSVTLIGTSDSGNTATEPISGSPVIVVSAKEAQVVIPPDLWEAISEDSIDLERLSLPTLKRTRLVPITTVAGRRMMLSYRPDRIEVKIKGRKKAVDGVIALDGGDGKKYDGAAAILPSSILR